MLELAQRPASGGRGGRTNPTYLLLADSLQKYGFVFLVVCKENTIPVSSIHFIKLHFSRVTIESQ